MNEIEKMYELAGIKPVQNMYRGEDNENWVLGYFFDSLYNALPENEKVKIKVKPLYQPFTAEKQIELIKWLSKKQYVYIIMSADKEYYLCADNSFISGYNKQFDKALAMFVNAYWQDLTEEEKQQVKGILE